MSAERTTGRRKKPAAPATIPATDILGGLKSGHILRQARWIWPLDSAYQNNTYAQFRRDFQLQTLPKKAPFFITADQSYVLYVNGNYIGRGPARGFQSTWAFDQYDLAPLLRRGHNWISIQGYNGGISNFQYLFQWIAGMICGGRWGKFQIVSDGSWSSRVSPAHRADVTRVSVQMGLQEQVDARLDDQSWIRSAQAPRGWPQGSAASACGTPPWNTLEPRGIPNLTTNLLPYHQACATAAGRCAPGHDDTPNIVRPLLAELEKLTWHPADNAGKHVGQSLEIQLPAAGRGRLSAMTVDLGTLGVGTLQLDISGAAGDEILDLHFTELLTDDGGPFIPKHALSSTIGINMAARLILKPGRTQYQFHQPMGHRYVAVIARNATSPLRVRLALRETRYPLEVTGSFASSDVLLNDIHRISQRTQQVCMMDAYVDTPWREQAQWWGDAQVQALNTFHLANDARLLERGLKIIGRQQLPNGLTFSHAPTNCQHCVIPSFSITWGMTFHDLYWQTGQTGAFTAHLDKIDRLISYFEGEGRASNGLLRYDPRYWHYVDWAEVNTPQTIAPLNLWYLKMLEKLAATANAAAEPKRAEHWLTIRANLARLVTEAFWDEQKGLWRDGLEGKARMRHSVHSQMLAISNGLLPERHEEIIRRGVLPFLHGKKVHGGTPSSFWATYVYHPLIRMGYAAEVVRHIRKMYGPMVPHGGTWETFVFVPGAGSVSHAWAAHALQHLAASLGGIRQTASAWQQLDFDPLITMPEVEWTETRVPTPHGIIESKWQRQAGRVSVALKLPPGVTAHVRLPGLAEQSASGSRNKWQVEIR